MKIARMGEPQVVMQNPMSLHNYFGWPTVTRLQNNRIAVVASGFRLKHVCPFGKAVISYSDDEGETYTLPAPVIDTPLDDRYGGSPPHLFRHSSGALISTYARRKIPFGILAMISTDEGKTWSTEHEIFIGGDCDDLGYPSCVELKDGSILTVFYSRKDKSSPAIISQQKWKLEL